MSPTAPDERAGRLEDAIGLEGLDQLIVGDLVRPGDSDRNSIADLTWLCGFTGSSGLGLVGGGVRAFTTDFRYVEKATAVLPGSFELIKATRHLLEALVPRMSGRVGIDPRTISLREHRRLGEMLAGADGPGSDVEIVEVEGVVERLRRVKDEPEIEAIAAASALTDQVYSELEQAGLKGRTEREVALWIESRMRELGASGAGFPPIVAAGPNGALPHAEPADREIGAGELVVVDIGAILDGYCSDCTRTYATSDPGELGREVYGVVLEAQELALESIRAGRDGVEIDTIARDAIEQAGYGDRFGHGLGHGVGIAVHEAPRLSQRSEDMLLAGDVVTVEPGVYLPGELGVRIEDLCFVTDDGIRNLCSRPKQLLEIG